MLYKHRVAAALSVTTALVACAPSTSWARRARTAAGKKVAARPKPASPTPQRYWRMSVSGEQIFRRPPLGDREERDGFSVGFEAPFMRLTASEYFFDTSRIVLRAAVPDGEAATIGWEAEGRPFTIKSKQLHLSWDGSPWNGSRPVGSTIIEAQINKLHVEAGEPGAEVPLAAAVKLLVDDAAINKEMTAIARVSVPFEGRFSGDDSGSYSESGQIIYDRRRNVLFYKARALSSWSNSSSLQQFTFENVSLQNLQQLLADKRGSIAYTSAPDMVKALPALGARLTGQKSVSALGPKPSG